MNLCVDFCRQIVLQVIVRDLGVLDETWHLITSLLRRRHSTLQKTELFLQLRKVKVLVLNHGFELPTINGHVIDFFHTFIKAFRDLFLKLDHVLIMHISAHVKKALKVSNLAPDLVLHRHELASLLPNVLHFLIDLLDLKADLFMILHGLFDVQAHSLLKRHNCLP